MVDDGFHQRGASVLASQRPVRSLNPGYCENRSNAKSTTRTVPATARKVGVPPKNAVITSRLRVEHNHHVEVGMEYRVILANPDRKVEGET